MTPGLRPRLRALRAYAGAQDTVRKAILESVRGNVREGGKMVFRFRGHLPGQEAVLHPNQEAILIFTTVSYRGSSTWPCPATIAPARIPS
jgi:hypothetical protein